MGLPRSLRGWVAKVRRSAHDAAAQLMQRPGVLYVTVGEKRRGGTRTATPSLIAYVEKKRDVRRKERIPSRIAVDGVTVATDIVELETYPRALGVRAGDLIFAADGDFGTASLAINHNGRGYVVTCAHVVANLASGLVFQSSVQEPSTLKKFALGKVPYVSPIRAATPTDEDIAFVETGNLRVDELGILFEPLPIRRIGNFSEAPDATYWYNSNGNRITCAHQEPVVANVPVRIDVDGASFLYKNFYALEVQSGIVAGGHSGAVVCRGDGADIVACGILFGAAPPNYAYVFPLNPTYTRNLGRLP